MKMAYFPAKSGATLVNRVSGLLAYFAAASSVGSPGALAVQLISAIIPTYKKITPPHERNFLLS